VFRSDGSSPETALALVAEATSLLTGDDPRVIRIHEEVQRPELLTYIKGRLGAY
jgi:hypothetical protein